MCIRGTPKYVAPEVILRRDHGTVIDSWSLGIMIYEMYFGHVPFRGTSRRDLYQRICGANLRFPKLKKIKFLFFASTTSILFSSHEAPTTTKSGLTSKLLSKNSSYTSI